MDHDADWEDGRAVRALLVVADGDPPETDLLGGVRRRVARRRVRRRVLADGKYVVPSRVTGTVDVDQAGRVRRLEVMPQRTGPTRVVMEFRDYGARETVLAPPASQVLPLIEWHRGETRP